VSGNLDATGGGGGSSGGDSGGDSGGTTIPVGAIRRIAEGVVISIVPGWALLSREGFLEWIRGYVLVWINEWVLNNIIGPIVDAVLGVGALIVETVLLVAFGTDRIIGGAPGLADGLLWVVTQLGGSAISISSQLIGVVATFNDAIAGAAAGAGLAAPIVVTALWMAELAVVGFVVWSIIRVIDLPFIDIDALILRVTFPFRWLLRRFS